MIIYGPEDCCALIVSRANVTNKVVKIANNNTSWTVGYSSEVVYGVWWDGTSWKYVINITADAYYFRMTALW